MIRKVWIPGEILPVPWVVSKFLSHLKDLRGVRKLKTGRCQLSQYLIDRMGDPEATR